MFKHYPFLKTFSLLALSAMMAACDSGGVGTTANPNLAGNGGGKFVYTGPAARDIDVSNFQYYLWQNVIDATRCGGCHNSEANTPVTPVFFDTSNVNVAFDQAVTVDPALLDMATINPLNAEFVMKLNGTHFCWETNSAICATLLAGWIDDWKNASNGGAASRQINLTAPANIRDPGDSKSFPPSHDVPAGSSFEETVYPLLVGTTPVIANDNCQNCHEEIATPLPQAPFFASGDVAAAYEAAKSKMDIDSPANSRFVQRLVEQHNCWSDCGTTPNDIGSDANDMLQVITDFANGISATEIDDTLVISKALTLGEGIIASGGNRHETDQFALWEFKTGSGLTAYDTSGVGDSVNLSMLGSVNWIGGYGLEFTGGRAQADTVSSDKIFTYLQDTREYAIEAWVIPANVTQEDSNIVSYSGGDTARNFTLGQDMYSYESYNRVNSAIPNANGEPVMSTGEDDEELAQASLQHVVINYDPFVGRSIYVNGQLVNNLTDTAAGESIETVWDDSFAFILGNEISGNRPWMGQVKMVALHSRALDQAQITQNFDVGVGQKFFLLFSVGDHLGEIGNPNSFIMFEVAQFDSFSYLFNKPTFITLDGSAPSADISIKGLRIGINGKEALTGQTYANLDTIVTAAGYDPATGQELSSKGTIITLEKGPESDEFFLTFEDFNGITKAFADIMPSVAADPTTDPGSPLESDIGMRTFEEINATIAKITGVPVTNAAVGAVYDDYIQQLPTVEAIGAFLPSHQMAIAQLALTSCSELVEDNGNISRAAFFPGFNFGTSAQTAFDTQAERDAIIDPLLTRAMNVDQTTPANNLNTQPVELEIADLLSSPSTQDLDPALTGDSYDSLITEMLSDLVNSPARTEQIVKAVCAVATGGAVMLVQ